MEPKYSLEEVFNLIDEGNEEKIWFSAPSRSINSVISAYASTDKPKGQEEAALFILEGIKNLTKDNFIENTLQWEVIMDVYGLTYDGLPWYVKFCIEDDCLNEVSFHPPEKTLTTLNGNVIWENKGEDNET